MAAITGVACSGGDKIDPNSRTDAHSDYRPTATAEVEAVMVPVWYEAVGTVAPSKTVAVAPQTDGNIVEMLTDVGQTVKAGDILFRIDSRTIDASLSQAEASLDAAIAAADLTASSRARVLRLFDQEAATTEQLEAANSADEQARAAVKRAEQGVVGIRTQLSYTQVISPIDGVVANRFADAGDLAMPGKPVLQLDGPSALDLVAAVRESNISMFSLGEEVEVLFPTTGLRCTATIREMQPAGDPTTRSFRVKMSLPADSQVRIGMYGKLRMQTEERKVAAIPAAGISRVGQLETVMVKTGDTWLRRFIRTGDETKDGFVEVLSGLDAGQTIGWMR